MSRSRRLQVDPALNESWPPDASTTRDRPCVPVVARVLWAHAGEQRLEGYVTRWSGRSVFVSPARERCRNGTLGVWLDVDDVRRLPARSREQGQLDRMDNAGDDGVFLDRSDQSAG